MVVELFRRGYALLDDADLPEEDRVDQVEELVRRERPAMSPSERERLVLDMLMAHHHGRPPEEAARPQLPTVASRPVRIPDPPRAAPKPALFKPATPPAQRQAAAPGEPSAQLPASPPFSPSFSPPFSPQRGSLPIPAPYPPSAYDTLRDVLGSQNSNEDIARALSHNDYDLARTLEMLSIAPRPVSQPSKEQVAERIMCKYFMSSGSCLRGSSCMYSHDGKQRICRFWLQGHCLAGDQCLFLHAVPDEVVRRFAVESAPLPPKPLPALGSLPALGAKPAKKTRPAVPTAVSTDKPRERPVVQFRPISEVLASPNKGLVPLVAPRLLPWKMPAFAENQRYVDLRLAAAKHAELRNKYLQQSTNAWSQNDPAKARDLSAEGQQYNDEMMNAYHTAADLLWSQRTLPSSEIYVDLHGMELSEALDHLEARLHQVEQAEKHSPRVVYVITSRGHFRARRVADQLSQYVTTYLDKHGYKHKDFGVDPTFGRVLGVDPWSSIIPALITT